MTVAAVSQPNFYAANGVQTTYPYDFELLSPADMLVAIIASPTNVTYPALGVGFSLTGVGLETGGTVTFIGDAIPPAGTTVMLMRVMSYEQPSSFSTVGYIDLPAIERAIDRQHLLITQLVEELARRVALPRETLATHRNLYLPPPVPLKVPGWNADASAWTYFDTALFTSSPDPVSGLTYLKQVVAVPAVAGQSHLEAVGFLPAGLICLGVVAYVSETCGSSGGLSSMAVGLLGQVERWAGALQRVAGSQSSLAAAPDPSPLSCPSATTVTITANSGVFDSTGAIILTAVGYTLTPETSV